MVVIKCPLGHKLHFQAGALVRGKEGRPQCMFLGCTSPTASRFFWLISGLDPVLVVSVPGGCVLTQVEGYAAWEPVFETLHILMSHKIAQCRLCVVL